jgi:calcium-dependent protein kinase
MSKAVSSSSPVAVAKAKGATGSISSTLKSAASAPAAKASEPALQWVIKATDPIEQYYTFGHRLGQPGQFGYALLASSKSQPVVKRAVKVISKSRFTRASEVKQHFATLKAEIETMKTLDHPNIIRLYEVYESVKDLYLVMELCSGGELFDRIKDKGSFSEKEAAVCLRQMCEGLKHMHAKGVAHCDLKPDNFLFAASSSEQIKIIDFGMSKFVEQRKYFSTICGKKAKFKFRFRSETYATHCFTILPSVHSFVCGFFLQALLTTWLLR